MLKKTIGGLGALAGGMAAMCAVAAEPNWRAAPTYATVDLTAGFMPDPWRRPVQAGGGSRVSRRLGSDCEGYINDATPDVDLNYTPDSRSLYIAAASSDADTTLVVYDPAGNWHCSDDEIGLDPLVAFESPLHGNYNIWIGVHGGSGVAPAELLISEIDPRGPAGSLSERPNWTATPTYETVALSAGFMPDPWNRYLQAGGSHDIGMSVGGQCSGYINAAAPDVDLNYDAGTATLHFHARASADTTLAVLDPDGTWHCNDDAINLDPVVTIPRPSSGNYNIWVGVRDAARIEPAELRITEIDPR